MALKSVLIDFSKVKTGEVTERDLTTEEAAVTKLNEILEAEED